MLIFKAFFHQLFIIGFCFVFRPEIVCFIESLVSGSCIAEMAEQLPFSCLCKTVVEKNSMEREREHAHKMERIE